MFRTLTLLILAIGLLASQASAEVLCAKKKVKVINGRIALANNLSIEEGESCPTSHQLIKSFEASPLVAFARVDETAVVRNFGGPNVTLATATQSIDSYTLFEVTFTGDFEGLTETDSSDNRSKLAVLSTAEAYDFGVTNAFVLSASATEIKVGVYLWKSDTLANGYQAGIHVAVMQGQAPPA